KASRAAPERLRPARTTRAGPGGSSAPLCRRWRRPRSPRPALRNARVRQGPGTGWLCRLAEPGWRPESPGRVLPQPARGRPTILPQAGTTLRRRRPTQPQSELLGFRTSGLDRAVPLGGDELFTGFILL